MDKAAIAIIQTHLKNLGVYFGIIDGIRSGIVDDAVENALIVRRVDLPADWSGWSPKRKLVALLQLICRDAGFDPTLIDGWWGPNTDNAFRSLKYNLATGQNPPSWRDDEPISANPHDWPTESNVAQFYGPHGTKDGSFRPPMDKVPCPWKLKIAWNLNQSRTFLWCHQKASASLGRVLDQVFTRYGKAEIERLRLNIFSGDYEPRLKKGGTTWSMHSWGIAFDFDDTNNQLKWGRDRATFAGPDYVDWWEIWESEGWLSLGRTKNYDWMHVQAAKL